MEKRSFHHKDLQDLLTPEEVAARWNIELRTLDQWRWGGKKKVPKYIKVGKHIYYPVQEVIKFEKSLLRRTTSDQDGSEEDGSEDE